MEKLVHTSNRGLPKGIYDSQLRLFLPQLKKIFNKEMTISFICLGALIFWTTLGFVDSLSATL